MIVITIIIIFYLFIYVIILGDFNGCLHLPTDIVVNNVTFLLDIPNFVQSVTNPTNMRNYTSYIIVSRQRELYFYSYATHSLFSDHYYVVCKLSISRLDANFDDYISRNIRSINAGISRR